MRPHSTRSRARVCLSVAVLIAGAACAEPAGSPPRSSAVDSAGVRVVVVAGEVDRAPTLTVREVGRHGLGAGEYTFQRILDGALLYDGRAVVADAGNAEVVRVGWDGDAHVLLGTGEGPGEVLRPVAVRVGGANEVWVDDDRTGRWTRIGPEGAIESFGLGGRWDLAGALRLRGVTAEGRLWMITSAFPSVIEGPFNRADLVLVDPVRLTADTVARHPIAAASGGQNPFQPYGSASVAGEGWVTGWPARAEVRWLRADGSLRQVVRWEAQPRSIDPAMIERYEAALADDLRRVNPGATEAEQRRIVANGPARLTIDPDTPLPFYRDVFGDPAGRAWIERYEAHLLPTTALDVIDRDGRWLGRARFPTPVRVLDIREGRVLAVVRDAFDVEAVAVFHVEVPAPAEEAGG